MGIDWLPPTSRSAITLKQILLSSYQAVRVKLKGKGEKTTNSLQNIKSCKISNKQI